MDNLEKSLANLSKIKPKKTFEESAKRRIMHQIHSKQADAWLWTFLKKLKQPLPSGRFMAEARERLMRQIESSASKPLILPRFAAFLRFIKQAAASSLVMLIAATSTLFVVEGKDQTLAANDSYLEVLSGTASVKHADSLSWEEVSQHIQLQAGDLIQLEEGESAIVHFFDDTVVRLDENSTLLIDQLAFSPNFSSQGVIKTHLQEGGRAWVQTLNVEDGYAGFTIETSSLSAQALHASFSISAQIDVPTEVSIFRGKVDVSPLDLVTREPLKTQRFTANKTIGLSTALEGDVELNTTTLTDEAKATSWVKQNLEQDATYLAELRERSYERLTIMAGTLPGDTLYPIKQAKERLRLLFNEENPLSVKIEMANNRLNEAIVLFERGEHEKANEALAAYQQLAEEIRQESEAQNQGGSEEIATQITAPHQKLLTVQPADQNVIVIKEKLQETAENFTQNPLDLEKKRLVHSVENLEDILTLIDQGQVDLAKQELARHQAEQDNLLLALGSMSDESKKREIFQEVLELRQEEKELLKLASESVLNQAKPDSQLISMVATATRETDVEVKEIQEAALPLLPELAENLEQEPEEEILTDEVVGIADLVARIYVYESWDGQLNQILRFFGEDLNNPERINYLKLVMQQLHGRAKDYFAVRILQLEKQIQPAQELPLEEPATNAVIQEANPDSQLPEWLQVEEPYSSTKDDQLTEERLDENTDSDSSEDTEREEGSELDSARL